MTELDDNQIIEELREFDTATICNVVATYPESDICLRLYDSWYGEYYTDQTLHCMYPELGSVCGYAATVWYSEDSTDYAKLDPWTLPDFLDGMKKPVVLVAKQTYPPELANRSGLFGGNMTAQLKALGVVGVVTDGPMRDYTEIKEMKIQYLATGLTSGHGPLALRAVKMPVKLAGMTVTLGDIIHMDVCGACKFPAEHLTNVLENAKELRRRETKLQETFTDPHFSLEKWKASTEKKTHY